MLICPNCLYQNPNGAAYCEACCFELPDATSCPNCGEPSPPNVKFCGSCGFLLQPVSALVFQETPNVIESAEIKPEESFEPPLNFLAPTSISQPDAALSSSTTVKVSTSPLVDTKIQNEAAHAQKLAASLLHIQSDFRIALNAEQPVIHIGKPNNKVNPDINLAAFSNAEVVSRIHADIFVENNHFFIEDKGSANGTFLNNARIQPGQKQPLTPGDKITLGKGNLVSFIFELS